MPVKADERIVQDVMRRLGNHEPRRLHHVPVIQRRQGPGVGGEAHVSAAERRVLGVLVRDLLPEARPARWCPVPPGHD